MLDWLWDQTMSSEDSISEEAINKSLSGVSLGYR